MTAYMIGWGVFFVYFVSVARRTADLRKEVERLKQALTREE
jgi:CcmD family protein